VSEVGVAGGGCSSRINDTIFRARAQQLIAGGNESPDGGS